MSERERLEELCMEYALGTLEGDELDELTRRLDVRDPDALEALVAARSSVAQLGLTAPSHSPPAAVKQTLLARIAADQNPSAPLEMPARRVGRREALAWAIAAAVLVFAVLSSRRKEELRDAVAELDQRNRILSEQRDRLAETSERFDRILAILSAPQTRTVALTAPENPKINAYWHAELGLMLAGDGLPASAPGRTLQLWVIPKQGDPVSIDVFEPAAGGRALLLADPAVAIESANLLAITNEPAGGSPQPTSQPIWVGPVG